jgi:hypothetical protein
MAIREFAKLSHDGRANALLSVGYDDPANGVSDKKVCA